MSQIKSLLERIPMTGYDPVLAERIAPHLPVNWQDVAEWLASRMDSCPDDMPGCSPVKHTMECSDCWLEAATEATR